MNQDDTPPPPASWSGFNWHFVTWCADPRSYFHLAGQCSERASWGGGCWPFHHPSQVRSTCWGVGHDQNNLAQRNRKKHKFRKEEIRFFSLTIFHSEPGHRTLQYEIKTRLILNAHCTRGIWTGATVAFTWRLWRATALTWKKSEERNGHNGEWKNKFSKEGEQMKQKLARTDRLLYSVHEKV